MPRAYEVVTSQVYIITNLVPVSRWLLDVKLSVAKWYQLRHLVAIHRTTFLSKSERKPNLRAKMLMYRQISYGMGEWTDSSSDEVMEVEQLSSKLTLTISHA